MKILGRKAELVNKTSQWWEVRSPFLFTVDIGLLAYADENPIMIAIDLVRVCIRGNEVVNIAKN